MGSILTTASLAKEIITKKNREISKILPKGLVCDDGDAEVA